MAEVSQGAGWWLASDGMWYPPELAAPPPHPLPTHKPGSMNARTSRKIRDQPNSRRLRLFQLSRPTQALRRCRRVPLATTARRSRVTRLWKMADMETSREPPTLVFGSPSSAKYQGVKDGGKEQTEGGMPRSCIQATGRGAMIGGELKTEGGTHLSSLPTTRRQSGHPLDGRRPTRAVLLPTRPLERMKHRVPPAHVFPDRMRDPVSVKASQPPLYLNMASHPRRGMNLRSPVSVRTADPRPPTEGHFAASAAPQS